jgi:hypothetical protein
MSPSDRLGLLVASSIGTAVFLLCLLDFKGWNSSVLAFFYRRWGSFLWNGWSEESYIAFNRFVSAGLGLAICLVGLAAGALTGW